MNLAAKFPPARGKVTALMSALLVLSLAACGGGSGDSALPATGSSPAATIPAAAPTAAAPSATPTGASAAPGSDTGVGSAPVSSTPVSVPVTDSASSGALAPTPAGASPVAGATDTTASTPAIDTTVATPSATATASAAPATGTAVTAATGSAAAAVDGRSKKRGLAYGGHSAADMQALSAGVTWWYNWSPKLDAGVVNTYQAAGEEFVPMIWGGNPTADDIAAQVPNGAKYLLGFNEPNFKSQSNKTPRQAAALWPVLQEVARRKNLQIGAPALNFCGDCVTDVDFNSSDPVVYMDAFLAACKDCKIDFIPVHWYNCDLSSLQWYIGKFKKYNKPIWLTEFSCANTPDITLAKQKAYITEAVKYLENEPTIARYSWFSGRNNEIPFINLLAPQSGVLTELGKLYISLPGATTSTGGAWSTQIEAESYANMQGVQVEGSSEGGSDVGWIDTGDWMIWNLTTPSAGNYKVEYRVASPNGGTIRLEKAGGGTTYGTIGVPNTGGWQNWQTISQVVSLPAGQQQVAIAVPAGGYNLNWLKFTKQ